MVGCNLLAGEGGGVFAIGFAEIPLGGAGDGFFEGPDRPPLQEMKSFVRSEVELRGFVAGLGVGGVVPIAAGVLDEFLAEVGDGAVAGQAWTEIEASGEFKAFLCAAIKAGSQPEVA